MSETFSSADLSEEFFSTSFLKIIWIPILLMGLFFRFFHLTTLLGWPRVDDGIHGFVAWKLLQNWNWNLFHLAPQIPAGYIWGLSLFFKGFGVSMETLFLFPAILSFLIVIAGYGASRHFFSKSFSVLIAIILSSNFWISYWGRFSQTGIVGVFYEIVTLGVLGIYFKFPSPVARIKIAFFLGLLSAGGFYLTNNWVVSAFFITLTLGIASFGKNKERLPFYSYAITSALAWFPWLVAVYQEQWGSYLFQLWHSPSTGGFDRITSVLSYETGLLWGSLGPAEYGPEWGGFLNPVLGGGFLLGLLVLWKKRREPLALWILSGTSICLLSASFAKQFIEFVRVSNVVPFVLLISSIGLLSLTRFVKVNWRPFLLIILLSISAGLDARHLFIACPQAWALPSQRWTPNIKSVEFWKAYGILKQTKIQKGPGLIFENFIDNFSDQTLMLATFPFNNAVHPPSSPATWGAVLANIHYQPFLKERLSQSQWIWLSEGLDRLDGGWVLGLFPLDGQNTQMLNRWQKTDLLFSDVDYAYIERPTGTSYEKVIHDLETVYPSIQGDRFLECCFWEKIYYLHLQDSMFGTHEMRQNFLLSFQAIQNAIQKGYPAAHLYNELGGCFMVGQKYPEAEKAFRAAIHSPINKTSAAENLGLLKKEEVNND
jgi:hypothetical protein